MTTGVACPTPILQFFDNNGNPCVGGTVLTQVGGVNTATYQDVNLTNPLPNPIPLNSRGEISTAAGVSSQLFLQPNTAYTFTLYDAAGNLLNQATYVDGLQILTLDWTDIVYDKTSAETLAGVTPLNYYYPTLWPERYGADPTGNTDSTAAFQSALNVAYQAQAQVIIGPNSKFLCGALTLTVSGNTVGIKGQGQGSQIICTGTPTAHLTITSSNPATTLTGVYGVLENFFMKGPGGTTTNGIVLAGLQGIALRDLYVEKYNYNLYVDASIDVHALKCSFSSGAWGVYARPTAASGPNVLTLDSCIMGSNTNWGVDFDGASGGQAASLLRVIGCDLESNGTNSSTGALQIGANIAGTLGISLVEIDGNWFESNSQSILVQAPSAGQTFISINNTQTLGDTTNAAITVNGGTSVSIRNSWSPSTNATWNITCFGLKLENANVYTLTDTGVTWPEYFNVATNTGHQYTGRKDSFTATLTGCTTSPTGTVTVSQQGADITLEFPQITGTSNTTACTLTGLPTKYQPASNQLQFAPAYDNGAVTPAVLEFDAASGTMTFDHTFTGSGTKGVLASSVRYRLAP